MKFFLILASVVIIFFFIKKDKGNSISIEEFHSLFQQNSKLNIIDVRTTGEYNGPLGHINGAKSIPLSNIQESIKNFNSDGNMIYYVICQSGGRSARATRIMIDNGINAINILGGMTAWTRLKK